LVIRGIDPAKQANKKYFDKMLIFFIRLFTNVTDDSIINVTSRKTGAEAAKKKKNTKGWIEMRKIAWLLVIGLMFSSVGCGATVPQQEAAAKNAQTAQQTQLKKDEADQKVADAQLKKDAVKADFVEINGHADKVIGKAVFAEGKVSVPENDYKNGIPSFTLTTAEGNGFGVYAVENISRVYGLKDGDMVKIYGKVGEPDQKTGMPTIACWTWERI